MTPDVVVDIGNSRIKWGVCRVDRVVDVIRLPLDDEAAWEAALAQLPPTQYARKWAVASVNPPAMLRFIGWSYNHGGTVVFENYKDLPIRLNVDEPENVGLDRLLGAIAAKSMAPVGTPVITVDVGTAVTVNLIDAAGVFQGGAIFPGPRLMARALHEFTAKLPLSEPTNHKADSVGPAKNTAAAIRAGILAALYGGVVDAVSGLDQPLSAQVFVTGGGAQFLQGCGLFGTPEWITIPTLTLEGIRITAEALLGRRHE